MIVNNKRCARIAIVAICLVLACLAGSGSGFASSGQQQKTGKEAIKAEDVVERAIYAYGSRAAIYNVQRNGILRGQIKFLSAEGAREGRTISKFIRKEKMSEDLLLLDLELPGTRYMIGFDGEKTWSINNGVAEEPLAETVATFRRAQSHSYEALLRYKENEGKLEYLGTKQFGPNNELDIVELTLPDGNKTRYEISRRSGRIIYLDYDEKVGEGAAVKYRLYFKDFRPIQNTLVPYEVQVFRDGQMVEERKLVEVAYNVQLEATAFKRENANKPAEAASKP